MRVNNIIHVNASVWYYMHAIKGQNQNATFDFIQHSPAPSLNLAKIVGLKNIEDPGVRHSAAVV